MEFVSVPSSHAFDVAREAASPAHWSVAKRHLSSARTRLPFTRGTRLSAVPPLQWWRRLPATAFTVEHLAVLRRAVSGIGMVGEPRWADAVHGHPAAAVAVARRLGEEPLLPNVDLTMSTVLIAVLVAVDPAAIGMLVAMIERIAAAGEKTVLARSWQGLQDRHLYGRIEVSHAAARIGADA